MTGLAFSAVVGQDVAKRALILAATQPLLGGVLLRGDKGSGKTTLARGLAALLPGDAPFVELPLGATEERVIGSLDLGELLTNGRPVLRPGLLAAAHGGVLYVDEINLLADHLVDTLLDVSASGVNRVERDGVSHTHPARFVLVGSMNPEEGELRPQLLDRFGLAVDVSAPSALAERALAVRRQLDAERGGGPLSFADVDDVLRRTIAAARAADLVIDDAVIDVAAALAVAVGAEGLRADLMLCRAAAAHAAVDGRARVEVDDVRAVAEMVLGHRRRRRPFDEPGISADQLDQAWETAQLPPPPPAAANGADHVDAPQTVNGAALPELHTGQNTARSVRTAGGFDRSAADRGRLIRARPYDATVGGDVNAHATAVAVATRRSISGDAAVLAVDDLRVAEREQRRASLIVFVLDASASMGVEHRMAATKGAIIGLLGDAYRRRGRVALITFRGETADVVLRPTASVEIARSRLLELATGGTTPLAAGLDAARALIADARSEHDLDCHVIVITDGRATAGDSDPVASSRAAAARLAAVAGTVVVIDTETGHTRLALARDLADAAGARYVHLDTFTLDNLEAIARDVAT